MHKDNLRRAAVAGTFYPSDPGELKELIRSFHKPIAKKIKAKACMLPHAGYIYSGAVAVNTLAGIEIPGICVLIGPNHTGRGEAFSIMQEGFWQTPFGDVRINTVLAQSICRYFKYLVVDEEAHILEHSLEVEVPILQYFSPAVEIVPITIASDDPELLEELGNAIALAIQAENLKDNSLVIASSDMSHYVSAEMAKINDQQAIKEIIGLNPSGLIQKVEELNISMCGYAPVASMLYAAKALGAKKAGLSGYQTSGDVTGDYASVVGYAGVVIS